MILSALKILKIFILKHKILFITVCAIQVISLFASLYVYSFLVSQNEYDKYNEGYRIFTVKYKESPNNRSLMEQIDAFTKSCDEPLQQMYITDEERFIDFDCIYRNEDKPIKYGRYFTKDEFNHNLNTVITEKEGNFGNPILGEEIMIEETGYSVIGTTYGNTILPLSAFSDVTHENDKVTIYFKNYLSDDAFEKVSRNITKIFKNAYVDLPSRATDSETFDIGIAGYLGLFLIALLNVAFVYKYILAQNRTIIYTFRTNGANKKQCVTVLLIAIFTFAIVSLAFGAALTRLFLPYLLDYTKMDSLGYFLKPMDYVKMIFVFLGVVAIVFVPFVSKTVNNISISDRIERD